MTGKTMTKMATALIAAAAIAVAGCGGGQDYEGTDAYQTGYKWMRMMASPRPRS